MAISTPGTSDPRWAEYDFGPDPVAWLRTTQAVRRVLLDRFGVGQLRTGEPVYDLQARFSLAYLYHRFGLQAAQQHVGGVYQTNALQGDGQVPVRTVDAAKQREALDLLIEALSPANLDVPEAALASLVPPPSGTARSREEFAAETGATFSPLTAARVLSGLAARPLLDPQRAARLTLAAGDNALTLDALLRRLLEATWEAPAPAQAPAGCPAARRPAYGARRDDGPLRRTRRPRRRCAPWSRAGSRARPAGSPPSGARPMPRPAADPAAGAHYWTAWRDLTEFLERPEVRRARPAPPPVPPGRPIGAAPLS